MRHTATPLILRTSVPVFPIETESEKVPVDVEGDTGGSAHSGGCGGKKSGDGEQRREHIEGNKSAKGG